MIRKPFLLIFFTILASGLFIKGEPGMSQTGNAGSTDGPYKNMIALFGDPHVHTNFSDGDESPDFALRYARDVSGLDFCCITDHSDIMANDNFAGLDYYRSLPGKYDEPGKFCVLFGYEWSSLWFGHRNVYSIDENIPVLPHNRSGSDDIHELWSQLEGYDAITIPHHVMIRSQENWWRFTNPEIESSVEYYSKWGMSLSENNDRPLLNNNYANGIIRVLVGEGTRYGIVAGSDTHMSRPGSDLEESRQDAALPYSRPGITGVWVSEFTREEIFNAIRDRHTYGMTGTRVVLEFSVDGYIMGSEIEASERPRIYVRASSEAEIDYILLEKITSTRMFCLLNVAVNANEFTGSVIDPGFSENCGYTVFVHLTNGDQAMASPVWVDKSDM